ncbi:hypothetical protein [Sphingobacterium chungjuense]|uniref:hypothetical protein n=1 Tax=Sphingobacterium chungjuense TaxID=2675553 RepID=UPI0014082452|nr:hypothetical protein [Sphingobacterium chungjuense]
MKANFFIIPESFKYSGDSQCNIEDKLKNFAIDLQRIKGISGNHIFCHIDVYGVEIIDSETISDILNDPNSSSLDRDIIQQLRIIWELQETSDSIDDICKVYLPSHNEEECYGLIAFNQIEDISPEYQLIYGIDGWFKFKRYFLGIYPQNADFFIDECKIYFEFLYFHEDNKNSVKRIFPSCVKKIIHHLSELNDKFPNSKTSPYNRLNTLDNFNVQYVHDGQAASPQGDIRKKRDLTFVFLNKENCSENVYCELHLKISHDDRNVFSNDRRIYFHEGIKQIQDGKILIGHIGKHL